MPHIHVVKAHCCIGTLCGSQCLRSTSIHHEKIAYVNMQVRFDSVLPSVYFTISLIVIVFWTKVAVLVVFAVIDVSDIVTKTTEGWKIGTSYR